MKYKGRKLLSISTFRPQDFILSRIEIQLSTCLKGAMIINYLIDIPQHDRVGGVGIVGVVVLRLARRIF